MTATQTATQALTAIVTKPLDFGTAIEFTNRWGQENCHARVLWHDGDTVSLDYLGCQHEFPVASITKVL